LGDRLERGGGSNTVLFIPVRAELVEALANHSTNSGRTVFIYLFNLVFFASFAQLLRLLRPVFFFFLEINPVWQRPAFNKLNHFLELV
jgi:hypothetical protein